jgi:hypothetical protein
MRNAPCVPKLVVLLKLRNLLICGKIAEGRAHWSDQTAKVLLPSI